MMRAPFIKVAVAAGAVLMLTGCVNVLPKTKPVQLYRFGYHADKVEKVTLAPATDMRVPVNLGAVDFPQESQGDRILTTEGNEVSYVGGSRWAAPVRQLFQDAVKEGFSRSATTVRLDPRGPSAAQYRLDLTVHKFESAYGRGRPTVSVALDARLTRLADRAVVGQRYVTADVAVRRSDMSLMAESYDEATSQVVAALIGFTQETIAANPVPDLKVQVKPAKPEA
jgi:cholesterol transport system auxiliary component